MPRFFCDYCDAYLTHDSAPGRQQHIRGTKKLPFHSILPSHFLLPYFCTHITLSSSFLYYQGWKHRENFKAYYQQFVQQWEMEQQQIMFQQMQQQQGGGGGGGQFPGGMTMPPPQMGQFGQPPPQMGQFGQPPPQFMPPMNMAPGMLPPPMFRPPPTFQPPPSFPDNMQSSGPPGQSSHENK